MSAVSAIAGKDRRPGTRHRGGNSLGRLAPDVGDDDARAGGTERAAQRLAEPASPTRHQRHATGERTGGRAR